MIYPAAKQEEDDEGTPGPVPKEHLTHRPAIYRRDWSLDLFERWRWQSQRDCRHSAQGCVLRSNRYPGFVSRKHGEP